MEKLLDDSHCLVSAVVLKRQSKHPWGDESWSFLGLIPGISPSELSDNQTKGTLYIFSDLTLQLHLLHCESYYQNLISNQPKVYLICDYTDDGQLKPVTLTLDYDEAASYMETGEYVFNAALSAALCKWLEEFVLKYYQPQKIKIRRREKWHIEK